ncbi:MAG: signal peptidase I [Planctomycetales bacterium]|nr:signal peptidase I [Planctomycetales bacterium]
MSGSRRRKLFLLIPIVVVVALGVVASLRYQGLLFPVRIGSGSMSESYLGPHRRIECKDCGFAFRCGLDVDVPLQRATCPNCGFDRIDVTLATLHEGDRVLIDRWAYVRNAPQRGDVVAFVDPTHQSELAVKRIMGLPNEAVTICHGELFIDGTLHRKSLAEAMELATLVYDDTCRPADERQLPPRWSSDQPESGWRAITNGHHWSTPRSEESAYDWLMYRHWRCYTSPHPRAEESPVTDNDSYNQGLSRELHEVSDLILSFDLRLEVASKIALLVHDGRESFTAVISTTKRSLELRRGEEVLTLATLPNLQRSSNVPLQFGVVDQQLLVAIAGATLVRYEYTPLDQPRQPTSRPFGIAGAEGEFSVKNVRVHRDIYYLNPFRGDWAWNSTGPLADESYLLLGDNAPLSNDSRHWKTPGLHRNLFVGKVLGPLR